MKKEDQRKSQLKMAPKKISQPIPKSSIASKRRWSICSIASVLMQVAFLQLIAMLLTMPSSSYAEIAEKKLVRILNNHTNILTVRCFSFNDDKSGGRHHLAPNEGFNFTVSPSRLFPSLSMSNCSTNMGVFIAYAHYYDCAQQSPQQPPQQPPDPCDWRFDENRTYYFSYQKQTWEVYDYHPNYESLGRGGVIKGYFTN